MGRPKKTHLGKPSVHRGRERVWWGGRWHDLGPEGSAEARAEYGRLAALWAVSPGAPALDPDDYLVSELCADYLASEDSPPPDSLHRSRVVLAVKLLLEHHAATPAGEFGPNDLRAWQTWMCGLMGKRKPEEKRFAITTVNYNVDAVRRIFKWGVSVERVPADKLVALRTVPRPKIGSARPARVVDPANPAHVKAALPFMLPPPRAMVVLQLAAGARPGEVMNMTPAEVHRGGVLNVPGAGRHDLDKLGVWAFVPKKHKLTWKGKPRVLLFAGQAKEVLAPYLDRDPDAPCFSPRDAIAGQQADRKANAKGPAKPEVAIVPARISDRYNCKTYWRAVTRACKNAGVPPWFPYQLRHLAAAEIQELYGIDAVKALLGHHTKTMSEHYAGLAVREAAKVAQSRG